MSRLAIITFISPGGGDVDNTLPGGPVYPSHGLPGLPPYVSGGPIYPGGHPGHGLPGGGDAVQLPVFPFDPTKPDQGLPDKPVVWPPRPGMRFMIKFMACVGLILVPDQGLPDGSGRPDQGLPEIPEPK
jgi:hypothetical protein